MGSFFKNIRRLFINVLSFFNINISSRIAIIMLTLCLFIGVLQVSTGYREVILEQEQLMLYEDNMKSVNYYYDKSLNTDYDDNMAIDDMIECYQGPGDLSELPDNVKNTINELERLYGSNSRNFSFLYHDLFSGFTVSYNADRPIFTASTIKAPAMIYIYEMASQGKIDLNENLIYTSNFYHGGSGELQYKKFNTSYTVDELVQYTIYESDNIAYKMLITRFGRTNIRDYWRGFGSKYLFENDTIWGYMSANDALTYMKELYSFSKENSEYGGKLLNYFKNAKWKMISNKDGGYNTANKGGWSGTAIHDIAIVFDENPYVLIVMSNRGEGGYNYLFSQTSKLVGFLHEDYWKYKVERCSNIKLY